MVLRWTVPEPTEAGMSPAARFRVMVYQQRAADACSSCPPVYRKIGEVEVPGNIKDAGMRFEHTIDSGYRYTVTVIAVSADGTVGPMSNAVAFEH